MRGTARLFSATAGCRRHASMPTIWRGVRRATRRWSSWSCRAGGRISGERRCGPIARRRNGADEIAVRGAGRLAESCRRWDEADISCMANHRRDSVGHMDQFLKRRRRYEAVLRSLGLWESFAAMPRKAQEMWFKLKAPDPVLVFDAS